MTEIKLIEILLKPLSLIFKGFGQDLIVDIDFPNRNGLTDKLKKSGYEVRWQREDDLELFKDKGWKIFKTTFFRKRLMFRDRAGNQVFIYKKS